jgi:hypothetical protein
MLAAVVGAGVVAGVVGAGVVVVLAAAGLDFAFVFGVEAGLMLALGVVLAFAAGSFVLRLRDLFLVTSGVALVAGFSAFAFGVVAGVFFLFDFLSNFVGGAVMVGVIAGASFVAAFSFMAGASCFGGRVGAGFSTDCSFLGGPCFLPGGCDASGVGS